MIEIRRAVAQRRGAFAVGALQFHPRRARCPGTRKGRETQLVGFSAPTTSFELPRGARRTGAPSSSWPSCSRTSCTGARDAAGDEPALHRCRRASSARGTSRSSDFTPSAALMIATATLIVGIVREVMMAEPRVGRTRQAASPSSTAPCPCPSRKGWLARFDCYPKGALRVRHRQRAVEHGTAWPATAACGPSRGRPCATSGARSAAWRIHYTFQR